jgi:hypothetical protein
LLLPAACLLPTAYGLPPPPQLTPEELQVREQKAAQDAVELLRLTPLAGEPSARRLRQRVSELLAGQKRDASVAELEALAGRLACTLPEAVRSAAQAREVLGPPHAVARLILCRRYVEQWSYDSPLSLCLVFDCRTGQEPRLQAVQRIPPGKM